MACGAARPGHVAAAPSTPGYIFFGVVGLASGHLLHTNYTLGRIAERPPDTGGDGEDVKPNWS